MQGVVKAYDPITGDGIVVCDTDLSDYELGADALVGSVLRMLRQGQRVIFDLDEAGRATRLRLGSEVDMRTPARPEARPGWFAFRRQPARSWSQPLDGERAP